MKKEKTIKLARKLKAPSSKLKASAGFSLIETIVAIAILTVSMVAPLTLAQRGLNASLYARDQVTAFYLAQEAIEYARNVRDNNNFNSLSGGANWLSGLENCTNQTCGIDTNISPSTIACSNPQNCQLVFNSTTGVYGDYGLRVAGGILSSGWRTTAFTRTLQITPNVPTAELGSNAAADLVATVSWRTGLISKSITINERIFNWYPATP